MRIEMIEKEVYTFEEVREKAIEKNRDVNIDYESWSEPTLENEKQKLNNVGFLDSEIFFSGFWSQGDGACFDCSDFDIDKILVELEKRNKLTGKKCKLLNKIKDYIKIEIDTTNTYYNHEKTRKLFAYSENLKDCYSFINNLICDFEKAAESLRLELSENIYKSLDNDYEYLTSDDAVKETLLLNEYEFDSNGNIC